MVHPEHIRAFLSRHQLQDAVLCLHTSYKSLGGVEGGPAAFVQAFLDSGCTLLSPAFFYDSETAPAGPAYRQNGIGTTNLPGVSFEDRPDQIDGSMGIVPKTILADPRARRTKSPHDSFCAVGPWTARLLADEDLVSVYAPYKALLAGDLPAWVVLVGVDFTSCTPLHFAEELAGRRLFRRWAVYHGETVEVEVGSCSDGFEALRPLVNSLEVEAPLGSSVVRIYPFRDLMALASEFVRKTPEITRCSDPGCPRCRDMLLGGRRL